MTNLTLIIGNKNYSSWSFRPWILLKQKNISFKEIRIPLGTPEWAEKIEQYSPTRKVPVLQDGNLSVWDSLAICEYLADKFPEKVLWPSAIHDRAVARAISAEMHSGFADLRTSMTLNCRAHLPGIGMTRDVAADIRRISQIWADCRARFGNRGDFLFGEFSIADAMYAPVALRFKTYSVTLDTVARAYVDAICQLPATQEWVAAAHLETEVLPQYEMPSK